MSTHPNAILLLRLTPDNLARKTYREILEENKTGTDSLDFDDDVSIEGTDYHHKVMEEDYDNGYQISAKEGDIIFFDMITYGYGETILWDALEKKKKALELWAKNICKQHNCSFEISIGANYW